MSDYWWEADDLVTRSALWMKYKAGPYKDHHRVECVCEGCCGPSLSKAIYQWNRVHQNAYNFNN